MWESVIEIFYAKPKKRGQAFFAGATDFSASASVSSVLHGAAVFYGATVVIAEGAIKAIRKGAASFIGLTALSANGGVRRSSSATFAGILNAVVSGSRRLVSMCSFGGQTIFSADGDTQRLSYSHLLIAGQSLALGGTAVPIVSTTPHPYNKKFNGGVFAGIQAVPVGVDETNELDSLVPLVSDTLPAPLNCGETVGPGIAEILFSEANRAFLVSGHGMGGTAYDGLKKGTQYYQLGIDQVTAGKAFLNPGGNYSGVFGIAMLHGETDQDLGGNSNYDLKLFQWFNDYNTDIKAITGQAADIPLFIYQINYGLDNASPAITPTSNGGATALDALKAHRNYPGKIILVGPNYPYIRTDGIHMYAHAERQLSVVYAQAMKRVLVDGATWNPLMPIDIQRSGAVIDVTFNVPEPPLVFDIERVLNPGWTDATAPYGFKYLDDSSSASIQSVAITGPTTIQIVLNQVPTGTNKRLAYAWNKPNAYGVALNGPFFGYRGCLRDSAEYPNPYNYDVFNWCVVFYEPVP